MPERSRLDSYERVEPGSREAWRRWLEQNHARGESVWLVYPRKGSGRPGPTVAEAVEEAICFGWIDSLPRRLDAERSMLLVSPRKPGSNWSAINKRRAEAMMAAGRMAPAGLARIEEAKADGSWTALDAVEALSVPADLGSALDALPAARANFDAFPPSARRGILEWILNARTAETRRRRIAETAELAAKNLRANQWRGSAGGAGR